MSWLLKWLFLFRRYCGQAWRRMLHTPRPARALPPLTVLGAPLPFLQGANLPWFSYGGDFGANAWNPDGGVGRKGRSEELLAHFQRWRGQGIEVLRWFLFCDGRAGIRFSPAGTPLGPDQHLYADIDAALEAAEAAGMRIIFVILDFLWFDRAAMVNGVQTGGRSRVVSNAARQRALRRRVLAPVLTRYGRSPAILAWDIVNEPEWATRGWGGGIIGPAVSFPAMRRFIRRTARLVHRHTGHLATVGLGNASGLPLVLGCGLDFYQVHWYDRWQEVAPLARPVQELGLDRPLLLGEFPARNSRLAPEAILSISRDSGYCGALRWSILAGDEFSDSAGTSG